MVLSGSWQIARLQKEIGNNFDWIAASNPCGPAACSGMPGGAAWVALKTTKSPKEVGQFLDFMAQEANVAEFASRTNTISAHAGVAAKGVDYPTAGPQAKAALTIFSSGTSTIAPAAYQYQGYKYNRALMLPTVSRVTQAIVGEIGVEEAINKINADMTEAVKQAQK
jgi:alpha-1,4-digalacturonate transport system substrate-binding protein